MIDIPLSSAVFIFFLAGFALIVILTQLKLERGSPDKSTSRRTKL